MGGKRTTELIRGAELSGAPAWLSASKQKEGLAISRIDGGDCFIRDDKTQAGRGGDRDGGTREQEKRPGKLFN